MNYRTSILVLLVFSSPSFGDTPSPPSPESTELIQLKKDAEDHPEKGKSAYLVAQYFQRNGDQDNYVIWLNKSSDLSYVEAQIELATLYMTCERYETNENSHKASGIVAHLFIQARDSGDKKILKRLEELRLTILKSKPTLIGLSGGYELTPAELKTLSARWEASNDGKAAFRLWQYYSFWERNTTLADLWLERGASAHDESSEYNLVGRLIHTQPLLQSNLKRAKELLADLESRGKLNDVEPDLLAGMRFEYEEVLKKSANPGFKEPND